jgi:hypothetical protein
MGGLSGLICQTLIDEEKKLQDKVRFLASFDQFPRACGQSL